MKTKGREDAMSKLNLTTHCAQPGQPFGPVSSFIGWLDALPKTAKFMAKIAREKKEAAERNDIQ